MVVKSIMVIVLCYFIGAVPFGVLLGLSFKNSDVRKHGSGNIGATNVLRTYGFKLGLPTLILDFGKGILAYYLTEAFGITDFAFTLCGIAVVVGHNWSIFLNFQGGKGVSTTYGFVLASFPIAVGVGIIGFIIIVVLSRYVSLGSLVGSCVATISTMVFNANPYIIITNICFTVLIFLRHKENIERLIMGTEKRI